MEVSTEINTAQNKTYLDYVKDLEPDYTLDGNLEKVCAQLNLYWKRLPSFETEGLSLAKGIILCGNVGTGKTLLMEAAKNNRANPFLMTTANRLSLKYQREGLDAIENYMGWASSYSIFNTMGICFDDLGAEPAGIKFMGTELNVMAEIILERYARRSTITFCFTHFTTNLTQKQIEERYGTRIMSRLKEMCNVIIIDSIDHRT